MTTTTTTSPPTSSPATTTGPGTRPHATAARSARRATRWRRITYLLLGLPLGTTSFAVVTTGLALGVATVPLALLGIPVLCGLWYAVRALANVERAVGRGLLDVPCPPAPLASGHGGGPWVRLRAMSREHLRWRELAFLVLRFPVGIGTAVIAAAALATPVAVATAPAVERWGGVDPFGHHALGRWLEDVAGAPWAWALVPVGVALLVAAVHALDAVASACARWSAWWLGGASA